jgi:hypothetical protein
MPSLTYTMDEFPLYIRRFVAGKTIQYQTDVVSGSLELDWDDGDGKPEILRIARIHIEDMNTKEVFELSPKDWLWSVLESEIDYVWHHTDRIDPYEGMGRKGFWAASNADFARDDRLSREAA